MICIAIDLDDVNTKDKPSGSNKVSSWGMKNSSGVKYFEYEINRRLSGVQR